MSENDLNGFQVEDPCNQETCPEIKVLKERSEQLTIYTSTPNNFNRMDFSFLQCYENIASGGGVQPVDTDSGYMSNPMEGTLDKEDPTIFVNKSPRFMSEDALLEKPVSMKKTKSNPAVYSEQISYFSSVTDSSTGSIVPDTEDDNEEKEEEQQLSPIIELKNIFFGVLEVVDETSNSSNKENENFEIKSKAKIANVKITPRKTPRKRRRSSSTSSTTPKKPFLNNMSADLSPDLFADAVEEVPVASKPVERITAKEQYGQKTDNLLMKRVRKCLSGVLPPLSITTTNVTVAQMLEKLKNPEHEEYFWHKSNSSGLNRSANDSTISIGSKTTLLVNTNLESCKISGWPHILHQRYHGLNYNHSKIAEDTEALFMKYAQRYIGNETQSSCTIFDSFASTPSKRKANRLRWVNNSPGRRLSHLARRRITFSSANIQASSSRNRQIMVDAKRFELLSRRISPRKGKSPRKTPRKGKSPRKTPRKGKSPRKSMCTPSSSAKKRLAFKVLDEENAGPSTSSIRASATKRALFQSPEKNTGVARVAKALPSTCNPSLSPWKKRGTPKRALFMSPSKTRENKRKRLDSEDTNDNCKFARSISLQIENQSRPCLPRVKSESLLHGHVTELSDHHKKKLQWAVYEALRSVSIRVDHDHFKQYASVLARVTRRLLPTIATANVGTSERMLRITKQHVYSVVKGQTMEEIVRNYENNRLKIQKPSGYIRKEDAAATESKERMDVGVARSNVFQDCANTIQSTEKKNVEKKIDNKVDRVKKIIKF